MLDSKWTKPCFYLEIKADVTELMGMRYFLRKTRGVKITSNAFFIRAVALAACRYPMMVGRLVPGDNNGNGNGPVVRIAENIHVGFAVNSPQGLVVPVVRYAEGLSLVEVAEEQKLLTAKARSNRLTLEDLAEQTITVSNLGAYDIDSFLGIVPPPVSTIVSVGKVVPEAVPQDGRVVVRKMVSLSVAADHRIIHSHYAAGFLQDLAEQLSHPEGLI